MEYPFTPGQEGSGVVAKVGPGVTGFKEGQEVVYLTTGSYAGYAIAPAKTSLPLPQGFDLAKAAATLLQGLTALTLAREAYPVQKNDWILVHAAAGGMGLQLVQIIKAIGGNVIGTASTREKIQLAKQHGADVVVGYSKEELRAKVNELTGGKGVHAVFDGVGKDTFDESLELVRLKGTVAAYGNASGAVPPFSIAYVVLKIPR